VVGTGRGDESKVSNLLRLAVLDDFEIVRAEIIDAVAVRVGDDGIDLDKIYVEVNRVIEIGYRRDILCARGRCLR